jgi:hypothetical protein
VVKRFNHKGILRFSQWHTKFINKSGEIHVIFITLHKIHFLSPLALKKQGNISDYEKMASRRFS